MEKGAMIPLLPARPTLHEALPYFYPFGGTQAHNALEGFGNSPDLAGDGLKVLFLGCCDLRGPLLAAASSPIHQNLEIHINNKSLPSIARSALILKIISSQTFEPEAETNMDYVWDLWYNTTWPESTLKRFVHDIKSLMNGPFPNSIIFPRSQDQEDLKNIWASWLTMIQTLCVESVLNDRSESMAKCWTRQGRISLENPSSNEDEEEDDDEDEDLEKESSFSQTVDKLTSLIAKNDVIFDFRADGANSMELAWKICVFEIHAYFKTGNCSAGRAKAKTLAANPTLLQPSSGKWLVPLPACPFAGYFPLPWKELEAESNVTALSYCRNELKKLLVAFRKRMEEVKFFFHPYDALALCYGESLDEFDVIDTSDLSDHVGMVNLLNAATRKLRSDQCVLFTEGNLWPNKAASNLVQYVQDALHCPLSLIPTIYGLRLIDDVELGLGTVRSVQRIFGSTRLRWTRVLPFGGVTLDLSSNLITAFDRLRTTCFFSSKGQSSPCTPLTFRYVMSDFFRRAGLEEPHSQWKKSFSPETIPLVHRMSVGTLQAWMERRPVWQVKISLPFDPAEQSFIKEDREMIPVLRLILIPNSLYSTAKSSERNDDELNHFIDNLDLKLRCCEEGTINQVLDVTFLLEDRSLLGTHCGIVVNLLDDSPVFLIGKLSERHPKVDLFSQPYPWANPAGTPNGTASSAGSKKLFIESCEELEDSYSVVFSVYTKHPEQPLQHVRIIHAFPLDQSSAPLSHFGSFLHPHHRLCLTPDRDQRQWPCESAHRFTIGYEEFRPVILTFPHPIHVASVFAFNPIAKCDKTKEHHIAVIFRKAPKDIWPEDVVQDRFRWNAEELKPWTKPEDSIDFHILAQFHPGNSFKHFVKDTPALGNMRMVILTMFHQVRNERIQHFHVGLKGSNLETNPEWIIRAHPPIRMSPQGVPILLLTAMDCRLTLRLKDFKQLDRKNCAETIYRNMCDDASGEIAFIWLHSDEEIRLFRYCLRLNSTRMRPTSWHKENITKEEGGSPWLATFIQPLYLDSDLGLDDIMRMMRTTDISELGAPVCARCRTSEEEKLKECRQCKVVFYCSVKCQKTDWKNHKSSCFKGNA